MVALTLSASPVLAGEGLSFDGLLDLQALGVREFLGRHPVWDGRGVAIAVLDTGVDGTVDGLERTSTGAVKVIEARDFTDECVVELEPARRTETPEEGVLWRARGSAVKGLDQVPGRSPDRPIYLGFLEESTFRNTPVPDLDGDRRTDGRIAIAVFQGPGGTWQAIVDPNGDQDFRDGEVRRTFAEDPRFVLLGGAGDPSRSSPKVPLAVNLEDAPNRAHLHVVTGSHGTHVAAIAAGHRLKGRDGFDGVAPGAVVLSLKIGHSGLAGGATVTGSMKKALEFAARWGREHRMPVVANLSYGVGSGIETDADIDRFLEDFLIQNPEVVVVCSAGNNGPGLSTVGTPGASRGALGVAAVLTPDLARELVGNAPPRSQVFFFSSRGGEAAKPDLAAPGIALAEVPRWERKDLMRGTSMAAPAASGVAALVLSGLVQQSPTTPWHAGQVMQALRQGSRPLPGYTPLDQGAGLLDVSRAWEALAGLVARPEGRWLSTLLARVPVPTLQGRPGSGAFWRAGGHVPGPGDPGEVSLQARYLAEAPATTRQTGSRRVTLRSEPSWVRLSRTALTLRGEDPVPVSWWLTPQGPRTPGLHTGMITARDDASGLEARIPVGIVIPDTLDQRGLPTLTRKGLVLGPGEVRRFFLLPPPGSATMTVRVSAAAGRPAEVRAMLYDGSGDRIPLPATVSATGGTEVAWVLSRGDLQGQGTLELCLVDGLHPGGDSTVDLEVRFGGLAPAQPPRLALQAGKGLAGEVVLENRFGVPFDGTVLGEVLGHERRSVRRLDREVLRIPLALAQDLEGVEVELSLSPEDFGRFTDIAVNVLDAQGKAVVQTGFSTPALKFLVRPQAGSPDLTIEITGGRTEARGAPVDVTLVERYLWRQKVSLEGTVEGSSRVRLWPSVRTRVRLQGSAAPPAAPPGFAWSARIECRQKGDPAPWLSLPFTVSP